MAHNQDPSGDASEAERQITFNIKASNEQKFVLTLPVSTPISELKAKLSAPEYADVPVERIRLIYSGRVLKDADTLATYKVADGNTIHMVKGAASNARQNPASSTSSAGATPAVPPAVPTMATGTGNNPLAGLTGARYAGFHGLPNASMFGADGGMGAPPGPEEMLRMLDDPNFAQMFNESMNNPDVLRILEQQPMIANNPMLRNIIRNPEMRRLMFSPEMLRMQLQMQRQLGGDAGGAFPMPGATDTTSGAANTTGNGATGGNTQNQPPNPFGNMGLFGGFPTQTGAAQANPFAAIFGSPLASAQGTTSSTSPPPTGSAGGQGTPSTTTDQPQQPNPFANLFGGATGARTGAGGTNSDIFEMARQMMQNPDMMRAMFGTPPAGPEATGTAAEGNQTNPFAALFGAGNPWAMAGGSPAPPDDRPPEERYAEQLRQLNDMGFFEFDRNIQALRRSGGSVQGAIEFLLGGT
ncbi:uncharacterized protein PV09_00705 [Verruconis gallopava]|uniref:Ubiquitin-like domain-containing protein n=1 Tax=Verruconis gallopava TaxID=253628 RepID=A0A0D1Z727_9PEZI|nr:uncharacterized protein PV09_00705 [Verruconis gallopava]KIW08767.1 hypothetical protein PV09_00705 [Verruconis gallopava]